MSIATFPMKKRQPKKMCIRDRPTSIGDMTRDQIDAELTKGLNSLQKERTYTPEEVDAILAKEFNI